MLKINSIQSVTLDFIRVFATQLVVIGHLLSFFQFTDNTPYIQNTGVVMFFILSGLIISYTVFYKSQFSYSFKHFFIERFSRIYTGLISSLIFIFLIDSLMQYMNISSYAFLDAFDVKTFFGNILMLQDYNFIGHYANQFIPIDFKITSFGSGRPLWTLAIEWWLYMCFGMIYFYYIKKFTWKYLFFLVLVAIVPFWNLIHGRGHGLSVYWILGVLITLYIFKKQELSKTFYVLGFVTFFIASILYILFNQVAYSVQYAFFIAGTIFFLLLYQQNNRISYDGVVAKTIRYLASYSFTLYLIHYSIIVFILSLNLKYSNMTLFIASFIFSNLSALLLSYLGERQYRKVAKYIKNGVKNA